MTTWTVYRHVGVDNSTLYIGCTSDLTKRTKAHSTAARWWDDVVRVEVVEVIADRVDALDREAELIWAAQPPYNDIHTLNQHPRNHTGSFAPAADRFVVDPSDVVWITARTGKTVHAVEQRERTLCGMRLDWRRVFVIDRPAEYDTPACAACAKRLATVERAA